MRSRVGSASALCTTATSRRSSGGAAIVAMVERMRAGLGNRAVLVRVISTRIYISAG